MGLEMKTIEDYLKYIGIVYFVEIILFIVLLFNGLRFFINDKSNTGVLLAVGMLTFVSVFFTFLYSLTNLRIMFNQFIDLSTNKMKSHVIEKLKSDDFSGIIKTTGDIESIKNLKNWVNPELWLHSSVFLYLFSLVFGLLSVGMSDNASITTKYVQGISFYLGLTCTLFLFTSIICLTFISKQKSNKK